MDRFPLYILALIFKFITRVRNALYDHNLLPSYSSLLPIICVGNLTVGGNGKTPLVRVLIKEMKKKGFAPVVLTRGYGGKIKGPHLVSSRDSFFDVGDEAILIATDAEAQVVVAKDRVSGAKYIEKNQLGNLIILDDGFQHRRLKRDLNIVCVSCGNKEEIDLFLSSALLPLGRFREEREYGLKRAKMAVLSSRNTDNSQVDPKLLACFPNETKIYRSAVKPLDVRMLNDCKEIPASKIVAFSGIANPKGFFATLKDLGFQTLEEKAFPDHHVFSENQIKDLVNQFPDQVLVTTEKDAIRLKDFSAVLKSKIAVLRVETEVTPHDAFFVQVQREISKK